MRKDIKCGVVCWLTLLLPVQAKALPAIDPEFDEILSSDISTLNVTSVNKRSQRLSDTPAAVYVITQEELRRAGIYSIPEALRLVPGVQVAKLSGDRWAISARGFNSAINNKLLVLIDGRAIYTPVFSGVYWGDQSTSINDIERIEVVRGPGASLYGANAVNGVVNIITKSADETQGNMISATTTSKGNGVYEARHGGKLAEQSYYRMYSQYYDGLSWQRKRAGFRVDGKNNDSDNYTLQGDMYHGTQDTSLTLASVTAPFITINKSTDDSYGGNVLGRWTRKLSGGSELSVQSYVDHYTRNEYIVAQRVSTADVQAQHSIKLDDRNNFIWGGGGRLYYQNLAGTFYANVNDRYDTHEILNVFAQNEYAIVPDTLYLTTGSKFEWNDFTGFEVQPTIRTMWHATENQSLWAAVSRAVRTPSSIEQDVNLLSQVTAGPNELRVFGNPNQKSEELIAYEIGHRIQPTDNVSFDTTVFFNDYDQLQTISGPSTAFVGPSGNNVIPFAATNFGKAHVYGAEIASSWNVTKDWRLGGSYTWLKMDLDVDPGTAMSLDAAEELAPRHQFAIQSYYNINDRLHWDNMVYYVDALSAPVGGYVRYDTRIAWMVMPGIEVSFIGRNLVESYPEFPSTPQNKVDHSFIGQVLWKF